MRLIRGRKPGHNCDYGIVREQCCVRVQVVKSESESSPLSPCPSPSHYLKVRVRVRVRVKQFFWVRVTNLVVHIFNICLSSKTWKQTTKHIECQSKQRNMARPLLLGLGHDLGSSHESRFLSPSPSQSEKTDSSPSHTALLERRLGQSRILTSVYVCLIHLFTISYRSLLGIIRNCIAVFLHF